MAIPPRVRACTILIAALAALTGCGDTPLEPSAVTGVWVLAAVDRQLVPIVVRNESDSAVILAADTLMLAPDASFTGTRCELRIDHALQHATTVCTRYHGTYRIRVRAIELRQECALGATCMGAALLTGTMAADRLVVRADVSAPELSYLRAE